MEAFRGGRNSGNGNGTGMAMIGSALLSGFGSSASSGTLIQCPPEYSSFFCQFTRIFKMIMMIVTLIGIVLIAYYFFIAPKSGRGFFGGVRSRGFRLI
jgi:hypothetical protein